MKLVRYKFKNVYVLERNFKFFTIYNILIKILANLLNINKN